MDTQKDGKTKKWYISTLLGTPTLGKGYAGEVMSHTDSAPASYEVIKSVGLYEVGVAGGTVSIASYSIVGNCYVLTGMLEGKPLVLLVQPAQTIVSAGEHLRGGV